MKKSILIGLMFLSFNLFGQRKKSFYYDENMVLISKKEFWKDKQDANKLHLNYDTDTGGIFVKVIRERRGVLDKNTLDGIKKDLASSANTSIDPANLIVVDYYPGKDKCNSTGTTDRDFIKNYHEEYLKNLHALAPVSQFNIYSQKEGLERYKGIYEWSPDLNDRIKKTFFKYHCPCGSVVVIRPDGNYIAYCGEYSKEWVWGCVRELIK